MEGYPCPSTSATIDNVAGVTTIGGSRKTQINQMDGTFIECLNVHLPRRETYVSCNDTKINSYYEDAKNDLRRAFSLYYSNKGSWSSRQLHLEWDEDRYLEDYYVPLEFNILTRNGKEIKEASLQLKNIFCQTNLHSRSVQRVLIQGHTGHGKSSLCDKIVNEWTSPSADFPSLREDFDLALLVRLKDVQTTIEDEIAKLCNNISFKQYSVDELMNVLKCMENRLLLILDGYNDATKDCCDSIGILLGDRRNGCLWQSSLRQANIIMTSRPTVPKEVYPYFDRFMSIAYLSVESQMAYIHLYFLNNPEKEKELKKIIEKKKEWFQQIYPLFFHILCFLHKQGVVIDQEETKSDFWEQLLSFIESRYQPEDASKEIDFEKLKHNLGKMSYQSLKNGQHYLELKNINQVHVFDAQEINFIKTCGIFYLEQSFLYPIHKMLMEYLSQQYLQRHWNDLNNELDRREFMSTLQISDTVHMLITENIFCSWIRIMRNSLVFILCLTGNGDEITSSQSKFIPSDEQQDYLSFVESRVEFSASLLIDAHLSVKTFFQRFISGIDDYPLPAEGFRHLTFFQDNGQSQLQLHIRCNKVILANLPEMLRQTCDFRFTYSLGLSNLSQGSEECDERILRTFQALVEVPPFSVKGHMERRLLMRFLAKHSSRLADSFILVLNGLTDDQVQEVKVWMNETFHNFKMKKITRKREENATDAESPTREYTFTKILSVMSGEKEEKIQKCMDLTLSTVFNITSFMKELKCDPIKTASTLFNVGEDDLINFFRNFGRVVDDKELSKLYIDEEKDEEMVRTTVATTYRIEITVRDFGCQKFSVKKNKDDSLLYADEKLYFEFQLLGGFAY